MGPPAVETSTHVCAATLKPMTLGSGLSFGTVAITICVLPTKFLHVEALTPSVMAVGGGAFGR